MFVFGGEDIAIAEPLVQVLFREQMPASKTPVGEQIDGVVSGFSDDPSSVERIETGDGGYYHGEGFATQLGFYARDGHVLVILNPGSADSADRASLENVAAQVLGIVN